MEVTTGTSEGSVTLYKQSIRTGERTIVGKWERSDPAIIFIDRLCEFSDWDGQSIKLDGESCDWVIESFEGILRSPETIEIINTEGFTFEETKQLLVEVRDALKVARVIAEENSGPDAVFEVYVDFDLLFD